MTGSERTRLFQLFEYTSQGVSAVAIAVGTLVLYGWVFDLAQLKSAFFGLVVMKANTALAFILAGVSLWTAGAQHRLRRMVSRFCGGSILLLGLLVLVEYLSGVDISIDQLLIRDITSLPGDIPGRMAVSTAICFASLGAALVLLSREKNDCVVAVHALAMVPVLVAGVALVSYGYDIDAFLREKLHYTPMALHTAMVLVLLGLGVVSARPDYPLRRILTSDSAAASTARRLLPTTIALQLVMGWLLLKGFQAGYLSEAVGLALFTVANIGALGALIQWNAVRLHQADTQRRLAEEALRESDRHIRQLLAELPTAVVVHGPDSSIRYGNATAGKLLGLSEDQLLGKTAFDPYWHFLRGDGSVMPVEEYPANRVIAENRPLRDYLVGIIRSTGAEPVWVYVNAFPKLASDGSLQEGIVSFVDITERRRAEQALQESEERYRSVIAALFEGVILMDADGAIRASNASAERILGLTVEQMDGRTFFDPLWRAVQEDGSPYPAEAHPGWATLQTGEPCHNVIMGVCKPGGTLAWLSINSQALFRPRDVKPYAVVTSFADITERKRAEEELRALQVQLREEAIRDPLTNLYNRRYLEETLQRELARAQRDGHPLSILMGDIDHFKLLNDNFGHQAGDKVLQALGSLLRQHARSSDIPSRYGGEEFVVVLPDMPLDAARQRAELVRRDFEDLRITFGGVQLEATLSIGVSVYPGDGKTADELIGVADQFLYNAKQNGRNRVCSAAAMPRTT